MTEYTENFDLIDVELACGKEVARELDLALNGKCYPMAVLLHRLTGYRMVAIFSDFDDESYHAAVLCADGRLLDALGIDTFENVASRYPCDWPTLVPITVTDAHEICEILDEDAIAEAKNLLARLPFHPAHRIAREHAAARRFS